MESKCRICERGRDGQSEFCARHKGAIDNLKTAYDIWKNALGIDWKTYLIEVSRNQETGEWVREVIQHMLTYESTVSPA